MSGSLAAQLFLRRLKPLLEARKLEWKPRNWRKTREFIQEEGLRTEDALAIICDLRADHFWRGPEPDDDGSPGDVMVFIYPYERQARNKISLYIKLKIWTDTQGDAGIVMSFHDEGNYE